MKAVFEQVSAECDENTTDWLLPNKILNQHIQELGLAKFIHQDLGSRDWWSSIRPYIMESETLPQNWYCIHWMNEEWRTQNINRSEAVQGSAYELLLKEYGIQHQKMGSKQLWRYKTLQLKSQLRSFLQPLTRFTK